MFYLLSKLLTFIVMPLGIILILIILMIKSKNRTKAKKLGLFTIFLTYLFSCPAVVNKALTLWESPQKNIEDLEATNAGVLLTGGLMNAYLPFNENLHLNYAGDRLWQTLHLYQKGKIQNIIITGGDISVLSKKKVTEIDLSKDFLIQNGVPPEHIFLEKKARNTHENAMYVKQLMDEKFPDQEIILITSAFHMKRAAACFKKEGVKLQTYPSHIMSMKTSLDLPDLLPSSGSFGLSETLFKEFVGLLVYKIAGYA
ncbi:YdcF family protein [Jiulongibacter sediminis]|jgi:uncharacterized SAM-binding protein YcdF (DUF218 family)|uniref:YdcF family protein n=1 Tax=Jiulongibacter sediminis TaxID=1605367 RepID=UPI0026EFBF85|nr:YdcF family protein [Jiulongibacter sediminis]